VASALGEEFDVVAPDLRGRAGSARLPGPYGFDVHADDVARLIDRLTDQGPRRLVLGGHSMGAFVATRAAAGPARERVHGLVLVDGGLPLERPPGVEVDALLAATLGPSLERLGRTFPDLAAVRAFWAAHPAVGPWVDVPTVAAYLSRDLLGSEPPFLHSACLPEAVRVDSADIWDEQRVLEAAGTLPVPTTLLWAPRGMLDQTPGLYTAERLAAMGLDRLRITAQEIADTNHYSMVWARHGTDAIAGAIRAAAAG
jgi:pimeloyl-ACP methyl ester carboxylesterase